MKKYLRMNKSRCCFIRIYWWEEEFVCLSVTWYGNVDIMASHLIYFVSCPAPPPGGDQTAGPHQPANVISTDRAVGQHKLGTEGNFTK